MPECRYDKYEVATQSDLERLERSINHENDMAKREILLEFNRLKSDASFRSLIHLYGFAIVVILLVLVLVKITGAG